MSGALAIGYSLNDKATPNPGLSLLGAGLSGRHSAQPVRVAGSSPRGTQVAVAALQGRLAYAFLNLSGSPRLVAGLAARRRHADHRARRWRSAVCRASTAKTAAAASPVVRTIVSPAMATIGDRAMLAYLRWGGAADAGCGSLIDAPSQPTCSRTCSS